MHLDQAATLRNKIAHSSSKEATIISVISGKGGVGKSNIGLNLAIQLSKRNEQVLIIDCDVGMANIDILMNHQTVSHLGHFLNGKKTLRSCIENIHYGFSFIGGGSSLEELTEINTSNRERFVHEFQEIMYEYDYIFLDFGAGMSAWHTSLIDASQEIIVITTPEPTSVMDAYASLKLLSKNFKNNHSIRFIVNRVEDEKESILIFNRMFIACQNFLKLPIEYLGYIREDLTVSKAVKAQIPFSVYEPKSKSSQNIVSIVKKIVQDDVAFQKKESFVDRFKNYFFERK